MIDSSQKYVYCICILISIHGVRKSFSQLGQKIVTAVKKILSEYHEILLLPQQINGYYDILRVTTYLSAYFLTNRVTGR